MTLIINNTTTNSEEMTQTMHMLAENPKKLPIMTNATDTFQKQFDNAIRRVNQMDKYMHNNPTGRQSMADFLKKNTFITVTFFYEYSNTKLSEKYVPITQLCHQIILVNKKYIDNVIENIRRVVAPGKVMIAPVHESDLLRTMQIQRYLFTNDSIREIISPSYDLDKITHHVTDMFNEDQYSLGRLGIYNSIDLNDPYSPIDWEQDNHALAFYNNLNDYIKTLSDDPENQRMLLWIAKSFLTIIILNNLSTQLAIEPYTIL